MVPKGLIIAIGVGMMAGAIFGLFFLDLKEVKQLEFVEGSSLSVVTEKTDYHKGEDITIKIINSGTVPLTFSDSSYGLRITGLDGRILYSPISAQVISILEPTEEITFVWYQIKNDGDPVLEGRYKIISSTIDEGKNTVKKSVTINILQ